MNTDLVFISAAWFLSLLFITVCWGVLYWSVKSKSPNSAVYGCIILAILFVFLYMVTSVIWWSKIVPTTYIE